MTRRSKIYVFISVSSLYLIYLYLPNLREREKSHSVKCYHLKNLHEVYIKIFYMCLTFLLSQNYFF